MTWNLFNNGQIGPTSSIASHAENIGFKKTAFGFRAAYIMVPISVKRATYMGCRFELTIDGEIASRSYAVNLPVFNNAMEPGYAYKYGLTLQRDTVLFNSVNIIDWNIIDMDGNPLIPEEVN